MKVGSFSWRLILGWFLILFGGLLALMQFLSLVLWSIGALYPGPWPRVMLGIVLQICAGLIWVAFGRSVLARRVWLPLFGCVVAYLCGVFGAMCLWPNGI